MSSDEFEQLITKNIPASVPGEQHMVPNNSRVLMSEELVNVIDDEPVDMSPKYLLSTLEFSNKEEPIVGSIVNIQVTASEINIELKTDMNDAMWLLDSALGVLDTPMGIVIDVLKIDRDSSGVELYGPMNVTSVMTSGPSIDGFCVLLLAIERSKRTTDVDLNT
jgi:hypothetical protein